MFRRNNIQLFVCVISLVIVCALSNPMYYKKNGNDKYEPGKVFVCLFFKCEYDKNSFKKTVIVQIDACCIIIV